MNDNQTPVSIGPYLLQFTGIYFAVNIAVMAFIYFTDINPPSVTGMLSVLVAAMTSGQSFASKHLRLMSRGERGKFALLAALVAVIGSFVLILGLFAILGVPLNYAGMMEAFGMPDMPSWAWILISLFAFIVSAIVAYFSVNITAKGYLKKLSKP